jgi:hypothetical protein
MRNGEDMFGFLELTARDIFLRPVRVTSAEILWILRDRRTGLFFLTTVALLVAVDAFQLGTHLTLTQICLLWGCTVAAQILLFVSQSLGWAWGQRRFGLFPLYLPVFNLIAFGASLQINGFVFASLSGVPSGITLLSSGALGGVVVALSMEALFFAFAFPLMRGELAPREPLRPDRTIGAAGETFAIDELCFMRSDGHYVEIATRTGTLRIRARLNDLVSQTEPGDGIRAHRSHWLARRAIARRIMARDGVQLELHDGTRFAVAGPRRAAVAAWVAQYLPDGGTAP